MRTQSAAGNQGVRALVARPPSIHRICANADRGRGYETPSSKQVRQIPLSEIDAADKRYQLRVHVNATDLVDSLRSHGQQVPLILWGEMPPYRIIDGFRRAEALAGLGQEFVSAIVRDDISDVDAFSLSFIDNVKRRNLSSVDKANAIWLALNRERISKNDIAISFGVSLRQISRYLQLLEFDEAIQAAVADARITMAHAVVLSRENPHSPLEVIDKIEREKISVPQLKKLFTSSARPGRTPSYIVREGNGFHLRPIRYYPSMPPTKIKQIAQALQQGLELIHRSKLERG